MTKRTSILLAVLLIGLSSVMSACTDNFLEPEPKSFLSPENTLSKRNGMKALMANLNVSVARQWYNDNSPMMTEYFFTDIAVNGNHENDRPHNMVTQVTPTGDGEAKTSGWWDDGYNGIIYANIIISNINNVTDFTSEEEKNAMLAAAFFHRAFWYYHLVMQFGDVPVYLEQITSPRLDFVSYEREAILKVIAADLEYATEHLPTTAPGGDVSQGAAYHLLTKVYLALRRFDDAIATSSKLIEGGQYALMTQRFGTGPYRNDPNFNVMWDLHQKENIQQGGANREAIWVAQSQYNVIGSPGMTQLIRNATPMWFMNGSVQTPAGKQGATDGPAGNPYSDSLGRGIGRLRTVDHYNYTVWNESGPEDLRHADVNWFSSDEFIYNNPNAGDWFGKPFVRGAVRDTTRSWYPFPYNKVYVRDEVNINRKAGGYSNMYIYRLAETYLLRAEAFWWKGDLANAAKDINAVRQRAGALPIDASQATIDYIFDERARELYPETPRKSELTRVAYIFAASNRDGYSLANMHEKNWFYDRVMRTNVYYRTKIQFGANAYVMEPYHVYWPVPQDEIDTNIEGHINQTPGYMGWEKNVPALGYEEILKLPRGEQSTN